MFGNSKHRGRWAGAAPFGGPGLGIAGTEATAEADYYDAVRRFGQDSAECAAARQRWSSVRHRRRHNLAG